MARFRIGAAKKEITPSLPVELSGYIRRFGKATGIHDPLLANFLSVEKEGKQVLFISLDLLFFDNDFSLKTRKKISEELKMEEKNILIAATHTHSAPGIHPFRNIDSRDKNWEEQVFDILIQGSRETFQNLIKATVGTSLGFTFIGKNRRIERGPVDPYFPILCFFDERELPLAVAANYGCHPVVLDERNLLISVDYVGYFRSYLNEFFSSDIVTLFYTGACGDVDPVSRGSFSAAEKLGKTLAEEALKEIKKMKFNSDIEIKTEEVSFKIPYEWLPDPEEAKDIYEKTLSHYEGAVKKGDKEAMKIQKAFLLWAEDLKKKANESKLPSCLECKLQCIKLGDAVFLSFPFELFSSISLVLREKSGIENLFMVGYANGYNGYLPDESSYAEGGYEIEEAFKYVGLLPLPSQAEKLFTENALSLMKSLGKQE